MERVWKGKRRREGGQKNESFSKNKNEKPPKEVEKDRGNEFHSLFVSTGAKKGNPLIEVQERIRLALSATYFLHVVILSSLPQEVYSAAHGFGHGERRFPLLSLRKDDERRRRTQFFK